MIPSIFFDHQDHELLCMINKILDNDPCSDKQKPTFDINLHPHGILELTTTHEFRVAHAVINLLSNIEAGKAEDRLHALQTLYDEVIHSAKTTFRYNTGRVLIQLMKDIVRSRHDEYQQLKLVHDFRRASTGNPNVVRKMLTKHHLLEMPEEWNQITMDHHVHDANTKGRKNATHLIMDAWIKGIRSLTVIYYNYVEPDIAREVLQAASIIGISVRIGLEFQLPFYTKFINIVWAPRGFSDPEDFLNFLAEKPVSELMKEGKKASQWMQRNVLIALELWNTKYQDDLATELDITLHKILPQEFLIYVGHGQASFLHLAEFIHKKLLPLLHEKAASLKKEYSLTPKQSIHITHRIHQLNMITVEFISKRWLNPDNNPEIAELIKPHFDTYTPDILKIPAQTLLSHLSKLRSGYRIILQLAGLTPEDVLEILWDCQGIITHLELFNLKEWQEGHLTHLSAINELQLAINSSNVLRLKQILHTMILRLKNSTSNVYPTRYKKFKIILYNIPKLQDLYKRAPLRSRIGTDSTSNSSLRHGMGLAAPETLPATSRKILAKKSSIKPLILPVQVPLSFQKIWTITEASSLMNSKLISFIRSIPGFKTFFMSKKEEWQALPDIKIKPYGNIITMGGLGTLTNNGIYLEVTPKKSYPTKGLGLSYLNTNLANILKIFIGFIPATLTFLYTQQWWVLAVFGSTIWFIITGLRNIAQAILGGGSLSQKSLLHWKSYINWTRICDSLMYTGLSVVLLELFIRTLLLENTFGLTISNHYIIVFSVIATCNGLYLACHNVFRGLPKEAVIGNIFRSILAIPISILYNDLLSGILLLFSVINPLTILQPGATIISKTASDTVAGIIEGFADRNNNYRIRFWDYKTKLKHFFNWYAKLELRFPDQDMLQLLAKPYKLMELLSNESPKLQKESIINALDFMYFWLYQPYAQQTFLSILKTMTIEEQLVFARGQNVLLLTNDVKHIFEDGYIGNNYTRALSFYLNAHENYLNAIITVVQHKSTKYIIQ